MYYMRYKEDPFKGTLYKRVNNKRILVAKKFRVKDCTDMNVMISLICQWISEGQAIDILDIAPKNFPTKIEFYDILDNNPSYAIMFEKAQSNRANSVVEKFYQMVEDADELNEKTAKTMLNLLYQIAKIFKDRSTAPKTVIQTEIVVPPIMKHLYDNPQKSKKV